MAGKLEFLFQEMSKTGTVDGATTQDQMKASRDWFRSAALQIQPGSVNANKLMSRDRTRLKSRLTQSDIGKMFMYFYDPKHKRRLPYYDTFPLVIVIGVQRDRSMGLNLHYLPPILRAKLMDALYGLISDQRYDDRTRLRLTYSLLKSAARYRWFKPCLKTYLNGHLLSRWYQLKATEWDSVLMLPTERFSKASRQQVWARSTIIAGGVRSTATNRAKAKKGKKK